MPQDSEVNQNMNSMFRKFFSADLVLNETITWVRPYSKKLEQLIFHSNIGFKTIYLPAIVLLLILCFKIFKTILLKNRKRSLGNRSLSEIKYLQDIVIEVHYASCYCGSDTKLIRRCKLLLDMYPAACNIPMHGHHYTPFLRACWNGCAELISYMIRNGANIRLTTDAGEGAIYLAAYSIIRKKSNDFAAIKILIAAGADVNIARSDGLTPVELALLKGHSRLARYLLAHGACPAAETTDFVRG